MSARVQVFPLRIAKGPDKGKLKGEWAFRIRSTNSKKWVVSEGYTRQRDAHRAASAFLVAIADTAAHEAKRVAEPGVFAPVIEDVDR